MEQREKIMRKKRTEFAIEELFFAFFGCLSVFATVEGKTSKGGKGRRRG